MSFSQIFIRSQEGQRAPFFAAAPLFTGGDPGSYLLEHRPLDRGFLPAHTFDDHILMLPLGRQAVRFRSRLDGKVVTGLIAPHRFRFLAQGDSLATEWDEPLEAMFLTISPALLRHVFGEDVADQQVHLASNMLSPPDSLLSYLLLALESHARDQSRPAGKLLEEYLLTTIATRVIQRFGDGLRHDRAPNDLPRWKRVQIEQFILDQLAEPMSLAKIAAFVHMSPSHLCRLFKASTGKSLWQFVLEHRAQAALRLMMKSPTLPLSQVADRCGFESYAQFLVSFRKFYGRLPSELRGSLHRQGEGDPLA